MSIKLTALVPEHTELALLGDANPLLGKIIMAIPEPFSLAGSTLNRTQNYMPVVIMRMGVMNDIPYYDVMRLQHQPRPSDTSATLYPLVSIDACVAPFVRTDAMDRINLQAHFFREQFDVIGKISKPALFGAFSQWMASGMHCYKVAHERSLMPSQAGYTPSGLARRPNAWIDQQAIGIGPAVKIFGLRNDGPTS